MKPHDEWNSADIADHARRAMHLETVDYGDEPEPTSPPGWWIWVYLVALVFGALVVGIAYSAWRIF